MTDQGFVAHATGRITVELPDGRTLECRALELREAVPFLQLLDRATRDNDWGAVLELIDTLPRAIEAEGAFDHLTPGEFIAFAFRFFGARRWTKNGTPPPARTTPARAPATTT